MIEVTKQKFEFYLEKNCDGSIFNIFKDDNRVDYLWFKGDNLIASQTVLIGETRRIYAVKI